MRENYVKMYNNLDDKFLELLPKCTKVEIDNMNSLITKDEMELFKKPSYKNKSPPKKKKKTPKPKTPVSDNFTGESYYIFKLEIIPSLHTVFQKKEKMGEYFHLILRS